MKTILKQGAVVAMLSAAKPRQRIRVKASVLFMWLEGKAHHEGHEAHDGKLKVLRVTFFGAN